MIAALDQSGSTQQEDTVGIWPENWQTVAAFSRVLSQWNTQVFPTGRLYYVGLNYAGVAAALAGYGYAQSPELWDGIRIMEAEAKAALNAI